MTLDQGQTDRVVLTHSLQRLVRQAVVLFYCDVSPWNIKPKVSLLWCIALWYQINGGQGKRIMQWIHLSSLWRLINMNYIQNLQFTRMWIFIDGHYSLIYMYNSIIKYINNSRFNNVWKPWTVYRQRQWLLTESVVHTDSVEVVTRPRTVDQVRVREVR